MVWCGPCGFNRSSDSQFLTNVRCVFLGLCFDCHKHNFVDHNSWNMASSGGETPRCVLLVRRLLSVTSLGHKIADIERILTSPDKTDIPSEDCSLYCHFIKALISNLTASSLKNVEEEELYDEIVLRGAPDDVLLILGTSVQQCEKSYKRDRIVILLEKFFRGKYFERMLERQCRRNLKQVDSASWSLLETLLVSLPERLANVLEKDVPKALTVDVYFASLSKGLLHALDDARELLGRNIDVHVTFLSMLLGRLCAVGRTKEIVETLVPELICRCKADFVYRRVCNKVVAAVPDASLENLVTALLSAIGNFTQVDWFLGDSVNTSSKLKYILTVKLPLVRTFSNVKVLQNLIGYLASSDRRRPLFQGLLKELLNVWGDKTFMKHQSEVQQKYLTSALMICTGHLREQKYNGADKEALMSSLVHGVHSHIESPEEWVRNYGMVVAEHLSIVLLPGGPKFGFECPSNTDVAYLLSLTDVAPKDDVVSIANVDTKPPAAMQEGNSKSQERNSEPQERIPVPELDSDDDDLEAYDMTHDKPNSAKKPAYLRDCMEGLLEQEDRDWTESCLQSAEELFNRCPDELEDIACEFCKILLYLEDKYSFPDFLPLRKRSLVTLCVKSPKSVATYLTEQFYETNLNIRQRLEILEVLALASEQLSKPVAVASSASTQEDSISNITKSHWKSVVLERLQAKTKRIGHGKRKEVTAAKNRFADVAGYFFYPLMRYYDRKENTFDLLGEDSFVLARLICTLGIVQNSAVHSPKSCHMASCLLEFISSLRYHTEASVRDAILFALSIILLNVPPSFLLLDLQHEMVDIRQWLQFVVEKDSFEMCRLKAAQLLQLLAFLVNKETPSLDK